MTEQELVWVEIKPSLKNIEEALKKQIEPIDCTNPECHNNHSVEFNMILRDPTKLDVLTGLAPKVNHPARLCRDCLEELRKELLRMKEEDD